jgi:hypothetical protein
MQIQCAIFLKREKDSVCQDIEKKWTLPIGIVPIATGEAMHRIPFRGKNQAFSGGGIENKDH